MKNQSLKIVRFSFSMLALGAMILPPNLMFQTRAAEKIESEKPTAIEQTAEQPAANRVAFEENRGQIDARVRYFARAAGSTVFLTADEAIAQLNR